MARPETPAPSAPARFAMQVLWPAFLGAVIACGVLFSLVDPRDIDLVETRFGGSREAGYTLGFLVLWALFSGSCALSWTLARTGRARRR